MANEILYKIEKLHIPLPDYFRSADLMRLQKALSRRLVYGQVNPHLTRDNFSKVPKEKRSHYFTEFHENGEKLFGSLCILNNQAGRELAEKLTAMENSGFKIARRMNNDPWRLDTDVNGAPGFFAIDLQIG